MFDIGASRGAGGGVGGGGVREGNGIDENAGSVRGQVSRRLELGLRFDCKRLHEEKLTRGVDYLSIST